MKYPVDPRQVYIVTPTVDGTVTDAASGVVLCTFSVGNQSWFQAPDGVTSVIVSDDAALFTPLD